MLVVDQKLKLCQIEISILQFSARKLLLKAILQRGLSGVKLQAVFCSQKLSKKKKLCTKIPDTWMKLVEGLGTDTM